MDPSEEQFQPKKPWLSAHHVIGYVFLLVVAAAAVAGIYYWQTTSNLDMAYQSEPVHQDPTANWQTYTNAQYGFSFKLPQGWIQNGNPTIDQSTVLINFASPESQQDRLFKDYGGLLDVSIYQNPNSLSISNFFNAKNNVDDLYDQPDGTMTKTAPLTIDSRTAERFYDLEGESDTQAAVVDDNTRFIEISDASNPTIIDQILSTFKFVSPPAVASTQVTLTKIQPASGAVGSKITLTGTGFSATGNSIKFGTGYINDLDSDTGTTIVFTVPDGLGVCKPGEAVCPMIEMQVAPGTYPVSVLNSNGAESNSLNFTVSQ